MRNPYNGKGRSPCSLSSSDSLRAGEGSFSKDSILQLMEILSTPRESGGFGSSLRYCDVGLLLKQLGCTWSTERIDDCWYDMVHGRPDGVVNDMEWAAQCIYNYMQGKWIELAPQRLNSAMMFEDCGGSTTVLSLTPERVVSVLSPESRPDIPDVPLSSSSSSTSTTSSKATTSLLHRKPIRQREEKDQQNVARDAAAIDGHSVDSEKPRYASPTLSSIQRTRSVSALSRQNKGKRVVTSTSAVNLSPRKRRLSPPQSSEVFQRLIEDAKNRKNRASTTTTTSPPEANTTPLYTKTNIERLDRPSSSKLIPRRPSPNTCRWIKPTKSYEAKLIPEPPLMDRLEAAVATPLVERQEPRGPSAFVPPGYVEAVARLRRFAASREHHQAFVDSLRRTSPTTPSVAVQSPILRLPMQDDVGKKKIVVDVRLATSPRSRHLLFPRDIPFDDPSRVVIQNVLRETRMRCR
ncbi:hypothetical protein LSM04_004742 [Trypanosoma melophagium]|uniref:uncharacterized protein n=1 Tax=Trypanosoma melophagium TaxID=715481 RepID=UPI00351A7B8D|nr:hypothetical protein LSM04_004742 [Trypanosoma melophagium]